MPWHIKKILDPFSARVTVGTHGEVPWRVLCCLLGPERNEGTGEGVRGVYRRWFEKVCNVFFGGCCHTTIVLHYLSVFRASNGAGGKDTPG